MGAILMSGMIFAGCSNKEQSSSQVSSTNTSSVSESSAVSNSEESSATVESHKSDSSVSQPVTAKPNHGTTAENTTSAPNDARFDAHFNKNPITAAHTAESGNVYTTNDMLQVEEKYAGIWSKEVDHAYDLCQKQLPADVFATVKKHHEAWLSTQQADLADIRADGQEQGGSMATVQIASNTAAYYQKQAKNLYKALYQHGISYQYQFKS